MRQLATTLATAALLGPAALATTASPAVAQDVQYETVTRMNIPGAVGTVLRVAARLSGSSLETTETTYIQGNRMRTDSDGSSTIVDLDARRMILLDHEARTYSIISFDEAVRAARAAAEAMQVEARQDEPRRADGEHDPEVEMRFRLAVDPANQRERLHGYNAERFFITMEAEAEYTPEPEEGEEPGDREQTGTLVVLTDIWTSRDMPAYGARARFDETSAREYAEQTSALMRAITQAFAEDPQVAAAFEDAAEQARQIEGMPLRTTTHIVVVPHGREFDRPLALGERRQGVAQQAGRAALGRLARRAAPAAQEAEDEPQQQTVLTTTTEVRNIRVGNLDAALFAPPADYREVRYDMEY